MVKIGSGIHLKFIAIFCLLSIAVLPQTQSTKTVMTVFAHGATGRPGHAKNFRPAFVDPDNYTAITFPDTLVEDGSHYLNTLIFYLAKSGWNRHITPSNSYFGQGQDLEKMHEDILSQTLPTQPIILFGLCRGGSAVINYLARYNPENVQAIVIEASPSDMLEMYHTKFASLGIPTQGSEMIFKNLWSAYPKDAITPVQAIPMIANKNLPILIIHSRQDVHFPLSNGLRLYKAFKQAGFTQVHLAIIGGRHAYSLKDDKENYLRAVHSFYKKYGFAYNEQYAMQDVADFAYDLDQAQAEIDLAQSQIQDTIHQAQVRLIPYAAGAAAASLLAGLMLYSSSRSVHL